MWKFWSAGRIICSRQIFLLFFLPVFFGCGNSKPQQTDPQIVQLQNDVRRLSDDNQRLKIEVEVLRRQLNQSQPANTPQTAPDTKPVQVMTVEEMKKGVAPILKDTVESIKKASETPKSGNQFGMRIEYDLKHAVYGLVQNQDENAPYSAKVIVKFEKFLESGNASRSYGSGSSTFLFSYRAGEWVLDSSQNATTTTPNDEQ